MSNKPVFKRDEILILLGAGASVEAGIPASRDMVSRIEQLLLAEWADYRDLYNFVKSSIHYLDGLKGRFDATAFNIEQLVSTLDELRRGDEHPLYPFVGAWVPKLYEVAGAGLRKISEFRSAIVRRLRDDWVQLRYHTDASYYGGLVRFQEEFQHPLRVFTLNYDLCVEKNCGTSIQRGFDESRRWDWRLFEDRQEAENKLLLYKLHGSIDWTYDAEKNLTYVDGFSHIAPDDIAIIFGTTYKLQYVDPFLFFAYELRRYTLDFAKLIVTVGYGFADQHINGILSQSLNRDPKRRLLAVSLIKGEDAEDKQRKEKDRLEWIRQQLNLRPESQVKVYNMGGNEFLSQGLTLRLFGELFPGEDENLFEEIGQETQPKAPPDSGQPSATPGLDSCTEPEPPASAATPSSNQDTLEEKQRPRRTARAARRKKGE